MLLRRSSYFDRKMGFSHQLPDTLIHHHGQNEREGHEGAHDTVGLLRISSTVPGALLELGEISPDPEIFH
jgi:hypothetical protein